MSNRINQMVSIWKDVESLIRRTTVSRRHSLLNTYNSEIVQSGILLWEMCLHDLQNSLGSPPSWDLKQHVQYVLSWDFDQLVLMLKECDKFLIHGCECDVSYSYDDFKHHLALDFPKSGNILFPLKELCAEWSNNSSTTAFRSLHTAFCFLSRINLKGLTDLEAQAMQDYVDREEQILQSGFTTEESAILSTWFPRGRGSVAYSSLYNSDSFKHGPGSVADCSRSLAEKYKSIGRDCMTDYLDNRLCDVITPRPREHFDRCSKVVFVPKTALSLRTICAEPTTLQWYQQGFSHNISAYISEHSYLRKRINLQDQGLNQNLAWLGSFDGKLSTIDLSSASDTVSWFLVKEWFRHTSLREILWACRSYRSICPDGTLTELHKFAPMGSALCFPIECLVFASMVEAVLLEVGVHPYTITYRVYGDDIIVDTRFADLLIERLQRNGFTVNDSKTFTYTSSLIYRESCGGEYLNGDDVTPIRLSRRFSGLVPDLRDASTVERLIELANDCHNHLPTIRQRVIQSLNFRAGYRVPFNGTGEGMLFSISPTNYHIKETRYSVPLQEQISRAGGTQTEYFPDSPDDEDIRLYEYLRLTRDRKRLWFPEDACHVRLTPVRFAKWSSKDHFDLHS